MPYRDKEKAMAYAKEWKRKRREQKARKMGMQTNTSLAWPKEKLSKEWAMWIAACVDCECCLVLGSYWNKQRDSYNFHVGLQLQMTDEAIPKKMQELCGGFLGFSKSRHPRRKDMYTWMLGSNGLRWLIPQIKEFLMIKNRQAELITEFLALSKRGVSNRAEYNPRAQEIRAEMKKLNQRGYPAGERGKHTEPIIEIDSHE